MFTATLLTDPKSPSLDGALAANLRNAWGGGDVRWLAPDEAVEFELSTKPANQWDVCSEFQSLGVDLCIQDSVGRKKKLLLADMDSTMIGQECIDELAEVAGVGDQVRLVTAKAMNGELDFDDALRARLGLMKGLPENVIGEVLRDRISLASGGPGGVSTMKANGAYAALVSGGFTAFSAAVGSALGFDENRANVLGISKGKLTGDVDGTILGRQAKIEALKELCKKLGIDEADAMAVGDGANDLGMLHRAGAGVATHAKPTVAAECELRINHGDLTALLYLQGFSRDEFVPVAAPKL